MFDEGVRDDFVDDEEEVTDEGPPSTGATVSSKRKFQDAVGGGEVSRDASVAGASGRGTRMRKTLHHNQPAHVNPLRAAGHLLLELTPKVPDPIVDARQQRFEAEQATFQSAFLRAANEVKPFVDLKSPKEPILRIIEKDKTPSRISKKSVRDRERQGTSKYLYQHMEYCNQVLGFNEHFFDMKILLSIIRFCIDSIDFDKGDDASVVEATNRVEDSFTPVHRIDNGTSSISTTSTISSSIQSITDAMRSFGYQKDADSIPITVWIDARDAFTMAINIHDIEVRLKFLDILLASTKTGKNPDV